MQGLHAGWRAGRRAGRHAWRCAWRRAGRGAGRVRMTATPGDHAWRASRAVQQPECCAAARGGNLQWTRARCAADAALPAPRPPPRPPDRCVLPRGQQSGRQRDQGDEREDEGGGVTTRRMLCGGHCFFHKWSLLKRLRLSRRSRARRLDAYFQGGARSDAVTHVYPDTRPCRAPAHLPAGGVCPARDPGSGSEPDALCAQRRRGHAGAWL